MPRIKAIVGGEEERKDPYNESEEDREESKKV